MPHHRPKLAAVAVGVVPAAAALVVAAHADLAQAAAADPVVAEAARALAGVALAPVGAALLAAAEAGPHSMPVWPDASSTIQGSRILTITCGPPASSVVQGEPTTPPSGVCSTMSLWRTPQGLRFHLEG